MDLPCAKATPYFTPALVERLDNLPHRFEDAVDLRLLDDERRRESEGVGGVADQHAGLEALHECVVAPAARCPGLGRQFDRAHQTEIADVDDVGRTLDRVDRIFPVLLQRARALEQSLVLVRVERADARRAGEWMARIGIAVEKLD